MTGSTPLEEEGDSGPGQGDDRVGWARTEKGSEMAAERPAHAVWEGTLLERLGRLSNESTPILSDQPVTWAGSNAIQGKIEIRLTAELEG